MLSSHTESGSISVRSEAMKQCRSVNVTPLLSLYIYIYSHFLPLAILCVKLAFLPTSLSRLHD